MQARLASGPLIMMKVNGFAFLTGGSLPTAGRWIYWMIGFKILQAGF